MATTLTLPRRDGSLGPTGWPGRPVSPRRPGRCARVVYAAAHVVADPLADICPPQQAALDWEATRAFRRYLWSLGLGVAEAPAAKQAILAELFAGYDLRQIDAVLTAAVPDFSLLTSLPAASD